jgi:uncharacterized protein YcaQ
VLAHSTEKAWMDPAYLPVLSKIRQGKVAAERTTLLSPFDSLIWYRPRTSTLFNYDYRIECYTPAPKRIYGYYSLSILHRGRIVGRLDPSYDRKRRVLTVKAIHLEAGVPVTDELARDVGKALREYCAFLGGGTVDVQATYPEDLRGQIVRWM